MYKLLLLLAFVFSAFNAAASDIALVISPHQSSEAGKTVFENSYNVFKQLKLGDSLMIFNGTDASLIATLDIPNRPAFKHEKIRAKHNKSGLGKLLAFTQAMSQDGRALGAMDMPAVLADVARNYTAVTDIVLIGSALYANPHHEAMDMTAHEYPSDGFIMAPPASSVFGTKGLSYLEGKRIHWALTSTLDDSLYSEAVTRFYALYIHALGGKLVSFTANQEAVIKRLLDKARPLPFRYQMEHDGKLEMRSINQASVDKVQETQFISRTDLPVQSISKAKPLVLGIQWQGEGVDLDIYAQPVGAKKALYYGQNSSKDGVHVKDQRTGDNDEAQFYERVKFFKPIDVDALRIGVNLYSAPASGTTLDGTLSISLAGIIYQRPFQFDLSKGGNHGRDIKRTLESGNNTFYSQFFTVDDIVNAPTAVVSL